MSYLLCPRLPSTTIFKDGLATSIPESLKEFHEYVSVNFWFQLISSRGQMHILLLFILKSLNLVFSCFYYAAFMS